MLNINLSGRTAWVTGASRGIGRATAVALAKCGCDIAVGYYSKREEAQQVVDEIRALGRKSILVGGDMGVAADVSSAYNAIEAELGPVTILVNNAGVVADNLFMMIEDEDWEKVLGANLMGPVYTIRAVVRGMMMKRWGRIINLSSVAATKAGRGQANYAASKGAVEAMTRALAVEFASRGITVNAVAPGVIETDMSKEVVALGKDEIMDRQLVKRLGTPDEIAGWIAMLASNEYGSFVTGATVHVDGGLKMP